MKRLSPHHHRQSSDVRYGTIDAAGRLSIGRVDQMLGPGLSYAAATAVPRRLYIRFLDDPTPPPGWSEVPVIAHPGRYPHVRLTGPALHRLLHQARLEYPAPVRIRIDIASHQIILGRVR